MEKVTFEEISDRGREPAMWVSGGGMSQARQQSL